MINETDLNINNKSYINKDFVTIYNELIDMAKKISYKFNPETSNESDVFIVLLKLLAFVGDKNCYNSDKNILERFMPSATQFNSMQELCRELGYNMHYYIASQTKLMITYDDGVMRDDESAWDYWTKSYKTITLKAFETKFTTNAGDINYILTKDVTFSKGKNTQTAEVIQGELKSIKTLNEQDNSIVTLQDLDNNNRLYFPEVMVAQNGVFISGGSTGKSWEKVNTLNTQAIGSNVYIFAYDSKRRLPYIQFPDDISSLIGEGLTIKYIVTNGLNGNVSANSINTLLTNASSATDDSGDKYYKDEYTASTNFSVTNVNASITGQDIETINEAYNNFNKTVGTFETLVTCRDYANYIYRMLDDNGVFPRVSNVQVCDRRDDYNYSTKIVTFNDFGVDTIMDTSNITPYDLCLYPLNPMTAITKASYKDSFLPLFDIKKITQSLENSQTVSHNYKMLDDTDVYCFKNMYKLDAKISTTYRVDSVTQLSIRENIIKELMTKFNARNIDYGYEIPYDTILSTIENADPRIKSVSLFEPVIDTTVLLKDGSVRSFNNEYLKYISKNILAGRTALWKTYNDIQYEWGEETASGVQSIIPGVESVSTCVALNLPVNTEKTLGSNEVVQILSPNYLEGNIYAYGWLYEAHFVTNGLEIKNGDIYELKANEYVKIWGDDTTATAEKIFSAGDIIKPNFTLVDSNNKRLYLKTKEQISTMERNQDTLDNGGWYFYWVTNNKIISNGKVYSILNFDSNHKYVLKSNEYLYRTNKTFDVLYTYGPGTLLSYTGDNPFASLKCETVQETIDEEGITGLKNLFNYIMFNSSNALTLTEQKIITLIEKDKLENIGDSALSLYTEDSTTHIPNNNPLVSLSSSANIKYKFSENTEYTTLPTIPSSDTYYIRAILDINASDYKGQTLSDIDYMSIKVADGQPTPTTTLLNDVTFKLQYAKSLTGGNNINIQMYDFLTSEITNNLIYTYDYDEDLVPTHYDSVTNDGTYYKIPVSKTGDVITNGTIELSMYKSSTKDALLMLFFDAKSGGTFNVELTVSTGGSFTNLSNSESPTTLKDGLNVIVFKNVDSFTINAYDSGSTPTHTFLGTITLGNPVILDGKYTDDSSLDNIAINPKIKNKITSLADWGTLMGYINTYSSVFYYGCPQDNSKSLEEDLDSPYSLYEYNNIVNKITLSEIDIDYAIDNIIIAKSSQA